MERLSLTLFGSARVERGGVPLQFDTRKATALVAYLAVTGRPHRRDALAAMLWPASDQVKARSALRRTLSVAGTLGPALHAGREEVTLDPTHLSCDVTEFARLVDRRDPGSRQAAIALATDDFMAGFSLRDSPAFDDWQAATADHLRDQLVSALGEAVDAATSSGDLDLALRLSRRWLSTDPMNEAAHCHAMSLLTWAGQRPAALQQYRSLVRTLDRELGVSPLPDTVALYDAIRANRLPPPESPSPVTAGPVQPEPSNVLPAPETSSPIVGRDRERDRLLATWKSSVERGRLAGVVAGPGMGRTSLSTDLATQVVQLGGRSHVIRAHEGERGLALAPARDLVRALTRDDAMRSGIGAHLLEELSPLSPSLNELGDRAEPLISPGDLERLFEAVRRLLEGSLAGEPPGLLVIDDAHWLDPTSADLFAYALRRVPRGLMVLVTWRPGVGSSALADIVLNEGEVVALEPMSSAMVAALVRSHEAELNPVDVHRRTGGVPRLVMEYVAASASGSTEAGPVRDLALARLATASATARQLVGAAAVLGTVCDPELLRATAGRTEDETVEGLEEAVARGLLVEDHERDGYDFPHDLLRDVALEQTSLARQQLLHGRAADILMRRHAADASVFPAARVADHLVASGRQEDAASWYWLAAAESRALYAHREELEQLLSAQAGGFDPVLVHEAIGDCLKHLGRYRDALASYEQAAASSSDRFDTAVVEHKLASVHDRLGDWDIAQAHLESAAELLLPDGPDALRARVAADLALVLHRQGRRDQARLQAKAALACAEVSTDTLALAQVHNVLGVLDEGSGDLDSAVEHLEQSISLASSLPEVGPAVAANNNAARAFERAGRHDDALRSARYALELGERHGDRHRIGALHTNLADMLHRRGLEDEAEAEARAAAAAFAEVDDADIRPQVWTLVEWIA